MENFVELFVLELVQIYVGLLMLYVLIAKRKLMLFTGELKESCGENNLSTIWSSLDFSSNLEEKASMKLWNYKTFVVKSSRRWNTAKKKSPYLP